MLRRNDSVNVPAMAAAYVESFSGQLLPASQAVTGSAPTARDDSQQSSTPAVAATGPQQAGPTISLKTFKEIMDDLRRQLKDIHDLSDKVQPSGHLLTAERQTRSSSSSSSSSC